MSRNVVRQTNKAMMPQRVENLDEKVKRLAYALDQVIGALINARVIEVEYQADKKIRLVPAKPKPKGGFWQRLWGEGLDRGAGH